jgi:large subunit ribosomal protein L4
MPVLDVVNAKAEKVGSLELDDQVFGEVGNTHVVWEVVHHHLASRRAGTHATKTRGEVQGSNKKPWRQKGTGRARVGTIRNPLWRKGGVTFGPQPRDYSYALPRKKKRVAARRVVASLLQKERVTVVEELKLDAPKTREFCSILQGLGVPEKVLVLVNEADETLDRATGNLHGVKVALPESVNAYDLLKYRNLLATKDALGRLQEVLSR